MADQLATDIHGRGDQFEDAVGAREHFHLAHGVVHHENKLVATEARDEVVRTDAGTDSVGDRDEQTVAARVAQEVVHDLEAVEIDDEHGRSAAGVQSVLQFSNEGSAVRQAGEVVVVRVVRRALLGFDPSLELDKHRSHGLERVDLRRYPGVKPEVQEREHAPGGVTQQQRHGGPVDERDAGAFLHSLEVLLGVVRDASEVRALQVSGHHEDGISVEGHLAQRVGIGHLAVGPLGFQNAHAAHVIVAAKKGHVRAQELGEDASGPGQYFLAVRRGR